MADTRRRKAEPWFRFAILTIKPALLVLLRRRHSGHEHIPQSGGVIVAANHISYVDPLDLALFVLNAGRRVRYLAKSTLFKVPGFGTLLRGCHQIPVYRDSPDANLVLRDAIASVNAGQCLVIYPEGTVTRDPDGWPMRAKTGVARVALATGAPVVPIGQWGAQHVLPYKSKRPKLFPRKVLQVKAGPPLDFSRYAGQPQTVELLQQITDEIMRAVTELVADLRGETPPAKPFEFRRSSERRKTA
ncbi:MAG: lysophospholipid acyltransferase family protein [Mycobacteriales bacterium]|nr:1-acyl-sn-glycerol-3-phosphate acyltransferase [Frankia sp.]